MSGYGGGSGRHSTVLSVVQKDRRTTKRRRSDERERPRVRARNRRLEFLQFEAEADPQRVPAPRLWCVSPRETQLKPERASVQQKSLDFGKKVSAGIGFRLARGLDGRSRLWAARLVVRDSCAPWWLRCRASRGPALVSGPAGPPLTCSRRLRERRDERQDHLRQRTEGCCFFW